MKRLALVLSLSSLTLSASDVWLVHHEVAYTKCERTNTASGDRCFGWLERLERWQHNRAERREIDEYLKDYHGDGNS